MSPLRRLLRGTAGNTATLFALAMVPVLCVAGAAVDYGRVTQARAALSGALDASLAALGPSSGSGRGVGADLRAGMERRLGPAFATPWKIESVGEEGGRLVAVVSAEVATSVARLIGIPRVEVTVTAAMPRPD